jgi:hypothetical protein
VYDKGDQQDLNREKADIHAGDKLALVSWEKDGKVCCLTLIKAKMLRPLFLFDDKPFELEGVVIPPITEFAPEIKDKLSAGKGWRALGYARGIPEDRIKKLMSRFVAQREAQRLVLVAQAAEAARAAPPGSGRSSRASRRASGEGPHPRRGPCPPRSCWPAGRGSRHTPTTPSYGLPALSRRATSAFAESEGTSTCGNAADNDEARIADTAVAARIAVFVLIGLSGFCPWARKRSRECHRYIRRPVRSLR